MATVSEPSLKKIGVLLKQEYGNLGAHTLKAIGREAGYDVRMVNGRITVSELIPHHWWTRRLSARSCFCRAAEATGMLSHRQMVHAAWRYRLGRSKDDAVIYWQLNLRQEVVDGKLMWYGPDCHRLKSRNPTWAWALMKRHCGFSDIPYSPEHILFGTHLLRNLPPGETVCVVEAEKSAVILSELFPQYTWLAAGGLSELSPRKLNSLKAYKVVVVPDTDDTLTAYTRWYEVAQQAMSDFLWPRGNRIIVSDLLERHASASQKQRKIDLVDYYFENLLAGNCAPAGRQLQANCISKHP